MTEQKLYKELREKYGDRAQQAVLIEEMSELTKAVIKGWRDVDKRGYISEGARDSIVEETADVCIMIDQLISMFDMGYEVKMEMEDKLARTEMRLAEEKERSVKWE